MTDYTPSPITADTPRCAGPARNLPPHDSYCVTCGEDWPCSSVIPALVPEIVVLCGSTRFMDAFVEANKRLTLAGSIVLSVGAYTRALEGVSPEEAFGDEAKARLDELHKRKIDLADRVIVLNVDGYIGDSTRSEIAYAASHGKPIEYLEPNHGPSIAEEFPGAEREVADESAAMGALS